MARIVNDTITILDENQEELNTIVLSKNGLSYANLHFFINLYNKSFEHVIHDVCFNKIFIENINDNILDKCIDGYENFKNVLYSLYNFLEMKFPNKVSLINEQFSKFQFIKGFNVEVYDSLKDYKYDVIEFTFNDNGNEQYLQSYPIIPEFIDRMYYSCTHLDEIENDGRKAIVLFLGNEYFNTICRYFDDEKYVKMQKMIKCQLNSVIEQNKDQYEYLSKKISYKIHEEKNVYNDIDRFSDYLLSTLINKRSINFLEELHATLIKSDTNEPNFKLICDNITNLLFIHDLKDELECFLELRTKDTDENIVLTLLVYFYSYYTTEAYQELMNQHNGDQRTLD